MPNFKNDKELFISALVATMYHMALVDGKYDPAEKEYIAKVIREYKDYVGIIREVTNEFEQTNLKEEFIVNLLLQCKNKFNDAQNTALIKHSAKVLMADDDIVEEEILLIKTYLFTLDLPITLIDELIDTSKLSQN